MKIKVISVLFLLFFSANAQIVDSIFYENFDKSLTFWKSDSINPKVINLEIQNGELVFLHKKKINQFSTWNVFSLDYTADFTIEANVKFFSSSEQDVIGLKWASDDNENYNFFGISSQGYFHVFRIFHGKMDEIKPWATTQLLHGFGQWNKLKIERSGVKIAYFINDKMVFSHPVKNKISSGNHIGFFIQNMQKAAFDNFAIKGKFRRFREIKNAINGFKLENLGNNINSEYAELGPVISPDGNLLYIFRKNHPENTGGQNNTDDVWFSEKAENGTWNPLKNMGTPLNNSESNFVIAVSGDNNSLMITNQYKPNGSFKNIGLSISKKDSLGKWRVPLDIHVANYYNRNRYVTSSFSADKKYLISSVQRDETYGSLDLYISFRTSENEYSEPINLGKNINTHGAEFSPFLAADNKTLYFSSYGHPGYGSADVFISRRLDDTWQNWTVPENLGPEVNTKGWEAYFSLPASGEYAYLVSDAQSFGLSDIYRIKLPASAKPNPIVLVKGNVYNLKTKKPIKADVIYTDLQTDSLIGEANSEGLTGHYSIILEPQKKYAFRAERPGFYAINENLDLTDVVDYKEITKDLYLAPLEIGQRIRLNNVFFEYNKAELTKESKSELNRLIKLLNENPKIHIELAGHTDNQGSDDYNTKLSQNRVNEVAKYLTINGIQAIRLVPKGYGKAKPILPNTSDFNKSQNRRVEFVILKI